MACLSDLFSTGEARWLEVQIAGQNPQPRVLLASVPYALKAGDATTLGGLPASAFALAGAKVASAAVSAQGVTPDLASNVTTTGGTAGYLPEFSGAATIVDSPVFVNGSNVGIGTSTPAQTLDVNGTTVFRSNVYVWTLQRTKPPMIQLRIPSADAPFKPRDGLSGTPARLCPVEA